MIVFPNAKINLGLQIIAKRHDGYHEIASCLYPIPWRDILEILPDVSFGFTQTGLDIPGDSEENLCVKAYELLRNDFDLAPVAMHLHKIIPMGAGLGGGSSDGAFTLKLLNDLFELGLSADQLRSYASKLGSDCPFFIDNLPALATGTGTDLSPIDINLSGFHLWLVYPNAHVSTKAAYAGVTPKTPSIDLTQVLKQPLENWRGHLVNEFEASVFKEKPVISEVKQALIREGAIYAAMSGSGSAVFGIFSTDQSAKVKAFPYPSVCLSL